MKNMSFFLVFGALLPTGEAVPIHTSTYAMYSYILIVHTFLFLFLFLFSFFSGLMPVSSCSSSCC